MNLRRGYLSGIAVLFVIQLVTAFGAIGLLVRVSPAVEEILAENVYSNEAAEEMSSAMALAAAGIEGDHVARFNAALTRARENITEIEEVAVIDELEMLGHRALAGDREALDAAVRGTSHLIEINRLAMQRANERAQRLGTAGAWAAVALALAGWVVGVAVIRRSIVGIVEPIEELESVLESYRLGDTYRRCQARAASSEIRRILGSVNVLLDRANRMERGS